MNDWEADEDGKLHEILVYCVAPRKFCVLNRRKVERNEVIKIKKTRKMQLETHRTKYKRRHPSKKI